MNLVQLDNLRYIAGDPQTSGSAAARALLEVIVPDSLFEEVIAYPVGVERRMESEKSEDATGYLKVMPVPSDLFLTVQINHPLQDQMAIISVTDAQGKVIWREKIANSTCVIDTSSWESGLYLITLETASGVAESKPFIVQH